MFFSRLARRLLPASLFVLGAVALATAALVPASRRSATFREIVASVLYVENWALASKSVDYLAREEGSSPVQHFWAMSIQGQFYIIWFLVFLVAVSLGAHRIRTTLRVLLGVLFVGSLAFSVYLTALDQPLAYFHTGTRVWEFAAGGLLALGISQVDKIPPRVAAPLGWLGLALIISCGLLLQVSELFPGWVALWPVIGGILVLAYLTTRFIERPVRDAAGGSRPSLVYAVAMVTAAALLVGGGTVAARTAPVAELPLAEIDVADYPGPTAIIDGWEKAPEEYEKPPLPDLAVAKRARADVYDLGCHVGTNDSELKMCSFGDPDADVTIMLLGGSHSAHWQPGLQIVAEQRGWHLISATKSACTFTSWRLPEETVPEGYLERWAELEELGIEVVAVRDTPRSSQNQVECLEAHRDDPDACGVARSEFYADVDPASLLDPPPPNVTFLDLSHLLCDENWCPAIIGNIVVYHDHSHMSAPWSRSLAPYLDEIMPWPR